MYKKIQLALFVLANGTAIATPNDYHYAQQHVNNHATNKVTILFLQQSPTAALTPQQQGCYHLQLAPRDRIVYFSNQPQRLAGTIDNQQFLQLWKKNNIHPNVVLQGFYSTQQGEQEFTAAFVAKTVAFNQKTVSYHMCPLKSFPKLASNKLSHVTLFIDNFQGWPP